MWWVEFVMDLCFMADVLLNFLSVQIVRGEEISDPRRVATMYLRSWFIVDFISSIPQSAIRELLPKKLGAGAMLGRIMKLLKISRILKVFRLLRMSKFLDQHADEIDMMLITSSFTSWMHLLYLFGVMMYICHVMACLWAGIALAAASGWAHNDEEPEPYTWAYLYADGGDDDEDAFRKGETRAVLYRWLHQDFRGETEIVSSAYLACFYWAMTTITTVGYGDICPESDAERMYAIVAMVLGGGFYGFLVGNITAIVTSVDAAQQARATKMEDLHAYMTVRNFPHELRTEVHRYFRRFFDEKSALDESAVLNDLSPALRTKVAVHLLGDLVAGPRTIFTDLSPGVIYHLICALKPYWREAGGAIAVEGAADTVMFMLETGSAEATSRHFKLKAIRDAGVAEPETLDEDALEAEVQRVTATATRDGELDIISPIGAATVLAGETFGEAIALGLSKTYLMTVIACEPCKLQTIEEDDLQRVCEQHEGLRDMLRERAKAFDLERFSINVASSVSGSDSQRLLDCGYDDSLPPAPVHQPMNSSFLGGGGATLPAGFADMVEKKTSEMLDEISIHAERSLTFEARLTDLDLRVGKMAKAQGDALAALHEQVGRVLAHVAPDTPRAPPLGRGAGSARSRVTLTLVGRRIEAVNTKGAVSDPYLRILRRRQARCSRSFHDIMRDVPDDERSFVDSADVLWTSRVCRSTCNPNWGSVCLDVDDLDTGGAGHDPIVLQCWDWDRTQEHKIIGTATTTLRELTAGGTPMTKLRELHVGEAGHEGESLKDIFELAKLQEDVSAGKGMGAVSTLEMKLLKASKVELALMVRGSRDDNDSNLRRSGTLEITVDVLDGD